MPRLSDLANAEQAQRRAQMTHVGQFDNESIRTRRLSDLLRAPGRLAQGAFTGLAGAPVDIANMALQPMGLGSERPVGGSNYLASLINAPTESAAYQAGTMLPIGPEGLAVGGAKLAGLAGIFAGKSAKTANLAELVRAEEMAKAGIPDSEIWKQTGWTLNTPDKVPRFEIPDKNAYSLPLTKEQFENMIAGNPTSIERQRALAHPALSAAYPETKDIPVVVKRGNEEGSYSDFGDTGVIEVGMGTKAYRPKKSTTLHELQHAIQQREGFARGGSPEGMESFMRQSEQIREANKQSLPFRQWSAKQNRLLEELEGDELEAALKAHAKDYPESGAPYFDVTESPERAYRRLAGEAEARLTQSRMAMTPEQRLAQYPYEPEYFQQATGVPLQDLIVRNK